MTKRQLLFSRIILALYLVTVLAVCFANIKTPPSIQKTLFGIPTDKIAHFCMFLPMPLLAFFAFDRYTEKVWTSLLFTGLTFAVGVGLAAMTEWLQSMLPYRSGEQKDFIADVIALAVSSVIVIVLDVSKMKKKPSR